MKALLSNENIDLAIQYALGDNSAFDNLVEGYRNLFLTYLSDSNSSTLRETMVLQFLKYKCHDTKHGMDGYCTITGRQKEVKPCFVVEGQKVSSSGKFNDVTTELLNKKDGCDVVCSAFYEGRFLYIVEFPFELIKAVLQTKVDNAVIGRRVQADFGWKHYDNDQLKVWYFNESLAKDTNSLSKPHFNMLKERFKA